MATEVSENIGTRKLWLKYGFPSELEDRYFYIKEWESILKEKKETDEKDIIEKYHGNDYYGEAYTNLISFYNHIYAGLLITIYSALEYDLGTLLSLKKYSFKCMQCKLKDYGLDMKNIKNHQEVNDLREKCNSYKHNNGMIRHDNLKEETEEIDYTSLDIWDYYEKAYEFLVRLIEKVNSVKKYL